jgi:hypothetical protein
VILDLLNVLVEIRTRHLISENSYRFNRVWYNISSDDNLTVLPDSMHSINGLRLDHGVPVWFNEMDMVGNSKINPITVNII